MKDRVSLLASRIAEIEHGFSEREIREAITLLKRKRSHSSVQAFLLHNGNMPRNKKPRSSRKRKSIEEGRSKAVLDLELKDPEKYAVLSEFDTLLRKGTVLHEVVELKKFGKSLSKTFSTKSSRREAISKVMKLLSEKPLSEIRQIVANALSAHRSDDRDSDYYKLAQFIITGKTSPSQDERESGIVS